MRCPDCSKFVPYGDVEVEVLDYQLDSDDKLISGQVRVMLPCGDCGTELKEAELDFEIQFDHECPEGTKEWNPDNGDQFEMDEPDVSSSERTQDTDRNGKKIKSHRYMRHFYGADIDVTIRCLACEEEFSERTSVEEQASYFNEMV